MQNRIRSDPYRTTLVCIDSAQEGLLTGRVYHPYLPSGAEFKNLMQFLLVMEDLLDKLQFPQSFTAHRSFRMQPEPAPPLPSENEPHTGKIATFSVRVIFRQNASWQGSVTWLEEKRKRISAACWSWFCSCTVPPVRRTRTTRPKPAPEPPLRAHGPVCGFRSGIVRGIHVRANRSKERDAKPGG